MRARSEETLLEEEEMSLDSKGTVQSFLHLKVRGLKTSLEATLFSASGQGRVK